MALPAFGMISEVIPVFSRKPIFGYAFVAGSTVAIAVLSFGVWAHHMFAVGLGRVGRRCLRRVEHAHRRPDRREDLQLDRDDVGRRRSASRRRCSSPSRSSFSSSIGGLSGVTFAVVPIDWQMTDTYYVVAHFHYVLFGGTAFAVMAALYYWFPKMTGRLLDERLGRAALLADGRGLQPDLLRPALPRAAWGCRGACTRTRTCRTGRRSTWPRRSARSSSARSALVLAGQRRALAARRGDRGRQPVERVDARVGGDLAAARATTSTPSPGPRPAPALGPRAPGSA